jgi:hypothetical protein
VTEQLRDPPKGSDLDEHALHYVVAASAILRALSI